MVTLITILCAVTLLLFFIAIVILAYDINKLKKELEEYKLAEKKRVDKIDQRLIPIELDYFSKM